MMGRQAVDQSQLFYPFNLEEHIPADHLLRRINPIVTRVLVDLRQKLVPFYSSIGRPSVDPELMIRMLIVGYCYGIRFERNIPVWDMSKREDGILSRADFTFDSERNLYICPRGKFLRTTGTVHDGRTILYRASTRDCGPCPLKPKCTPNMTFRKIPRDVHEDARDATRALMGTPEFAKSRNERKKVEMRFAHVAEICKQQEKPGKTLFA
jgi:Transposase DDE domain/Transposase domain (DUF772)